MNKFFAPPPPEIFFKKLRKYHTTCRKHEMRKKCVASFFQYVKMTFYPPPPFLAPPPDFSKNGGNSIKHEHEMRKQFVSNISKIQQHPINIKNYAWRTDRHTHKRGGFNISRLGHSAWWEIINKIKSKLDLKHRSAGTGTWSQLCHYWDCRLGKVQVRQAWRHLAGVLNVPARWRIQPGLKLWFPQNQGGGVQSLWT